MIEITNLSSRWTVRRLDASDADEILSLCRGNPQFYAYCAAQATKEQILRDLEILPPGVSPSAKYYLGFFQDRELIAVLDLIDGYPEPGTAFIGFFMMNAAFQGRQIGSQIIRELSAYLRSAGWTKIRLGIDKGNPQSTHFWKKNGFAVAAEAVRGERTVLIAEKTL